VVAGLEFSHTDKLAHERFRNEDERAFPSDFTVAAGLVRRTD
jgi:hypothetical protein